MKKKNRYTVVYELDTASGRWAVSVKEEPGCNTQGKSLAQCRNRIREALSLSVDDAYEAELIDEIVMPREVCSLLDSVEKKQAELKTLQAETTELTASAALNRLLTNCDLIGKPSKTKSYKQTFLVIRFLVCVISFTALAGCSHHMIVKESLKNSEVL